MSPKNKTHPLLKKYYPEDYLYGAHAVEAALGNKQRRCKILITTPAKQARYQSLAEETDLRVISMPAAEMRKILPEGAVFQGVALIASALPILTDIPKNRDDNNLIMILDEVTDPHNVGAILRVCASFNCKTLIMQDRNAPKVTGAMAKVAVGATEIVDIIRVTNLGQMVKKLQKKNYMIYGADGESDTPLKKVDFAKKSVIIMGAEGDGIRAGLKAQCDQLIAISMTGNIESLNVSVASGIILNRYYEHIQTS